MVEDKIVGTDPSNQNAIDTFPGLWYSQFPAEFQVNAGQATHFEDVRLFWAMQQFQPKNNWEVLELGPMEGGHSYFMEKNTPVRSITAIEANRQCWVKCLIAKEIVDLKRTRFLLGNFMDYLETCDYRYDLCLALGVLYHMIDPLRLLELIAKVSPRVIIWTQLAGPDQQKSWDEIPLHSGKFEITGYRHNYNNTTNDDNFIGGVANYSTWLTKSDLLDALKYFGFSNLQLGQESENQFGQEITLTASK